jgi:hypothetical protein
MPSSSPCWTHLKLRDCLNCVLSLCVTAASDCPCSCRAVTRGFARFSSCIHTKAALLRRGSYQRKKSRDRSRLLTDSQFGQYTPSIGVSTEGYEPHEEGPVAVPPRIDREGRILKHSSSLGFGSGWMTATRKLPQNGCNVRGGDNSESKPIEC